MSLEVVFGVELDGVPLAGFNGVCSGEEVACTIRNSLGVCINLSLCEDTALEVCGSFLDCGDKCTCLAVRAPETGVLTNGNHVGYILVC